MFSCERARYQDHLHEQRPRPWRIMPAPNDRQIDVSVIEHINGSVWEHSGSVSDTDTPEMPIVQ